MKKYLNAFKSEIVTNLIIAKNYKFSFLMDIGIFISLIKSLLMYDYMINYVIVNIIVVSYIENY